ncbi:TetR/AcrR family transcriptional regulator [Baekduia sp.]|jgi:AcrR family transcriptional regulator|uniref:TetR/AcrR family transcriptional regulator n=1 Tax=Baekduia sp. TaxID=2600305 RepID=UPI002E00C6C1|nr:TetR family transcriptional regulator [Baekduia sp.]
MTDATSDARLRSDARRNRRTVLAAAVALLAQRPQATMQEVADASGLGRTTVYRHFPRRQDLIDALFAEVIRDAAETIEEALRSAHSARELLCELGPRFIAIGDRYRFIDAHPDLRVRALHPIDAITTPLEAYFTEAQERGELRDDVPIMWILTTLRGLGVVAMVEVNAGRMTVDEAGRHVGETCALAFTAPSTRPAAS